jgi:ABC-2 type transport system permease protein
MLSLALRAAKAYIWRMQLNLIGVKTLYYREVSRFLKVWNQTLTAPMVTTVLFFIILTVALGRGDREVAGMPFELFIAPGLIMMAVVQNAFANTSSSLMLQKFQGVIVDLLMPPLSAAEITFSMVAGGMTRGLMVAVTVAIAMYICVPYSIEHPVLAVVYLLLSSAMLAFLGLFTGIWAQSFDQMSAITNYIITPLSFLSGTFYSVHFLPEVWQHISFFNPFFYMIDGFRYALTDHADGDIATGLWVLSGINVVLALACWRLLHVGWRLKS